MRDKLFDYGNISLATKDVQVYSVDSIDHSTIDPKYRNTEHYTGNVENQNLGFYAAADFAAIDGFIPIIQDSADDVTYTDLLRGPEVTAPKKGLAYTLPMPKKHRRYTRASSIPKSSGTFTAKTMFASMEPGAMQ